MVRFLLACSLLLGACSSGSSNPTPDAAADASSGPAPRSFGAACTTVSNTSTECDSGVCTDSFDQVGHDVCSKTCTMKMMTDTSCPTGSNGQFCNGKGFCKP